MARKEIGKQNKVEMTDELRLSALKVVLFSQLLTEGIDDVKGTSLHNGKVKVLSGNLSNVLAPMLRNEIDRVYKTDPEMTTNIFRELDNLVTRIAKTNVLDLVMINQIFTHYENHKQDWKNLFAVELTQLDT
jgi:hypothetical protein